MTNTSSTVKYRVGTARHGTARYMAAGGRVGNSGSEQRTYYFRIESSEATLGSFGSDPCPRICSTAAPPLKEYFCGEGGGRGGGEGRLNRESEEGHRPTLPPHPTHRND